MKSCFLLQRKYSFPVTSQGYLEGWGSSLRSLLFFFNLIYLFIFREREKEGEREGENHQCVVTSHTPPTEHLAHHPGVCPNWEWNQWPFGLQANAQSTEPHQPGLSEVSFVIALISFIKAQPTWPNHLPKAPHHTTIILGIVSTWFLGDHRYSIILTGYRGIWSDIKSDHRIKHFYYCRKVLLGSTQ